MHRMCLLVVGLVLLAGCADDPSSDPNLGTETIADCMVDQLEQTIDSSSKKKALQREALVASLRALSTRCL